MNSPPVTAGVDGSENGGGETLLMEILGGLLVGGIIASSNGFVRELLKPFQFTTGGAPIANPGVGPKLLALVGFLGYLLNVFRQVHGIGIVGKHEQFRREVGRGMSSGSRASSFLCLLLVLAFPGLTAAIMSSDGSEFLLKIPNTLSAIVGLPLPRIFWLYSAYFLTAVVYAIWDLITINSVGKKPRFRIYPNANCYEQYAQNWFTSATIVILGGLLLGFYVIHSIGLENATAFIGRPLAVAVVFLTVGYTAFDYVFNRHLYFG